MYIIKNRMFFNYLFNFRIFYSNYERKLFYLLYYIISLINNNNNKNIFIKRIG